MLVSHASEGIACVLMVLDASATWSDLYCDLDEGLVGLWPLLEPCDRKKVGPHFTSFDGPSSPVAENNLSTVLVMSYSHFHLLSISPFSQSLATPVLRK
jgi:hypothetical protein